MAGVFQLNSFAHGCESDGFFYIYFFDRRDRLRSPGIALSCATRVPDWRALASRGLGGERGPRPASLGSTQRSGGTCSDVSLGKLLAYRYDLPSVTVYQCIVTSNDRCRHAI